MSVHLRLPSGAYACGVGRRWSSCQITSTRGRRRVTCRGCMRTRAGAMSDLADPDEIRQSVAELGQAFGVTGEEYAARDKGNVAIVARAGAMSDLADPDEIRRRIREFGQSFGVTGSEASAGAEVLGQLIWDPAEQPSSQPGT